MKASLHGAKGGGPRLESLRPSAAMPGGEVELLGSGLQPKSDGQLPQVTIGDAPAHLALSRNDRAAIRVLDGTISGAVELDAGQGRSNGLTLRVAVPMSE